MAMKQAFRLYHTLLCAAMTVQLSQCIYLLLLRPDAEITKTVTVFSPPS